MKNVKFFNGQATDAREFNNAQTFKEEAILSRTTDVRSSGVVLDKSQDPIITTDAAKEVINVFGFVAYTNAGERIYVAKNSNPVVAAITNLKLEEQPSSSTGAFSTKLVTNGLAFPVSSQWSIVVKYKTVSKPPLAYHVTTGEVHQLVEDDSYEFRANRGHDTHSTEEILLANVTVSTDGSLTVDEKNREISSILPNAISIETDIATTTSSDGTYTGNITFEKHVNAVGTGTISSKNPHGLSPSDIGIDIGELANHQSLCHVDGIRSDNLASTVSALYPHFLRQTTSNQEHVYIERLSTELRELLVVNGKLITQADLPTTYDFNFANYASSDKVGYYLFLFDTNTNSIIAKGPYANEAAAEFVALLKDRALFPICSCKWAYVEFDYNGDGLNDTGSYDILPGTFKDRRVFNNTALSNFRPDQSFALSQFAPIYNDTAYIHNARIISKKNQTFYSLAGKGMTVVIDGGSAAGGTSVDVAFQAAAVVEPEAIIDQLLQAFTRINTAGNSYLVAYPRLTDDGYISISAPYSIELQSPPSTMTDARETLGFTTVTPDNTKNTSDLIKELIYTGERNGLVTFTYNSDEDVTRIDYLLGGGVRRYNTFRYSNGLIVEVKEVVEPL